MVTRGAAEAPVTAPADRVRATTVVFRVFLKVFIGTMIPYERFIRYRNKKSHCKETVTFITILIERLGRVPLTGVEPALPP